MVCMAKMCNSGLILPQHTMDLHNEIPLRIASVQMLYLQKTVVMELESNSSEM